MDKVAAPQRARPYHFQLQWIIIILLIAILSGVYGYRLGIRAGNETQNQLTVMQTNNQAGNSGSSADFTTFLQQVARARYTDYSMLPSTKVQNEQEFETMRSHILTLYAGKQIVSSFREPNGLYWDCAVVAPSHANPPPFSPQSWGNGQTKNDPFINKAEPVTTGPEGTDHEVLNNRPINSAGCQEGTYPWMRVTLERLVQFPTLQEFLSGGKGPGSF